MEVDARQLGLPQRRRRVLAFAVRGGAACSAAPAAAAVAAQPVTVMADFFPGIQYFYHMHRTSAGPCIYDASTSPVPTLRTNCSYFPRTEAAYRSRAADSAPYASCTFFSLSQLGQCQGFPAN